MHFLTIEAVITLHNLSIDRFGGLAGIRDKHLLISAMAYPEMLYSIGSETNIYILASAYCYHIIQNHPFVDGNKRIGTLAMLTFLKINNAEINIPNSKLYELAMSVAKSQLKEHDLAIELERYASNYN